MPLENMEKSFIGNSNKKIRIINLYFEAVQKRYDFEIDENLSPSTGEYCIVETARGLEMGKVYTKATYVDPDSITVPLKRVIRVAVEKDMEKYNELKIEAVKASYILKNKIKKFNLNMKSIETEFIFDRKKLIFYFASEDRVDFRELVKELASIFKIRIELRQIGVRDQAKLIGDCGVCGKPLCCKAFINKFDSVTIKMARDQSVSVSPTKMSGICGRLKCCLNFEYGQYAEQQKFFPEIGQSVSTPLGKGFVVSTNVLNNFLFINVPDKGIVKLDLNEIQFNKEEKEKILKEIKRKTIDLKEIESVE